MRSSSVLTLIGATLAIASPIHHNLHKKAIVWDVVTDIVYVTVTEGQLPKSHQETTVTVKHTHFVNPIPATTSKKVVPTTSSTPLPPPPPSTTSTPPPPPPPATTEAPAPAPTTEEAVKAVVSSVAPAVQVVASPVAAVSDALPTDLESATVYYHNKIRAKHDAPALIWSDALASSAQKLADTCVFGHNMGIDGGGYGQNIDQMGMVGDAQDTAMDKTVSAWDKKIVIAQSIINDWYPAEAAEFDEKGFYGQANPGVLQNGLDLAHFTQIVWEDTTAVGCAVTYCGSKLMNNAWSWYTVCNYGPSGNFEGEFAQNVKRPSTVELPKVSPPWPTSQ